MATSSNTLHTTFVTRLRIMGRSRFESRSVLKQKATRDTQVGAVLAAGMPPHMLNNTAGSAASTPLTLAAAAQWLALPSLTLDTLTTQQGQLQDQIRQSEQNLAAQHTVLMQQQQTQIEDALRKSQEDALQRASDEAGISINEFDSVLQPIVDSCTKDSISSGKGWILQRSTSPKADEVIALHLLRKVIAQGCPFNQKLHIIYLVNDVLHHCARKNAEDLKKALENVVVPMFCNSSIGITEEQQLKLNKLLNLWESKNNYFDTAIVAKLKNPSRSWSEYQAGLITQHAAAITPITTSTKQTYEGYQAQHQAFIQHALQQIQYFLSFENGPFHSGLGKCRHELSVAPHFRRTKFDYETGPKPEGTNLTPQPELTQIFAPNGRGLNTIQGHFRQHLYRLQDNLDLEAEELKAYQDQLHLRPFADDTEEPERPLNHVAYQIASSKVLDGVK
uniref:CID domain-containing protein n=1 Tax=Timema poppense TaxID=170557 RepID=A0A7R9CYZ4_TIMPO|nr:unnamed protein product [Timema poppensis]